MFARREMSIQRKIYLRNTRLATFLRCRKRDMRKFKITYVRPGDSTWLYITVEAPSSSAAKQIAHSMLTGMKILNVTPVP